MSPQDTLDIDTACTLPFPRQTVFDAFARPGQLALWWGPDGFSNVIHRFEFENGGTWEITMTASDGTDFLNRSTFTEIVAPERIVFRHHEPIHLFDMDMRFEELGPQETRLSWRMRMPATEENRLMAKFFALANEQNFARLERVLAGLR
ncbi:Uncharacterized conserved protein YndB, AHSA1/START domain [Rhizobium sp. RU20A]|uniref:SRPBCC domain-containing protein n=1 Tax=Rhizobium sp. RU20A TaxID=1907412 RepID=UPI0009573F31|nr:SRPBCC domain-containing protein [Rhizobium sp. RU20A]SIQ25142.1 Uncharacterized conserved protein YndB, AHSA1/START domain [Rhizobium sp. RU20A]